MTSRQRRALWFLFGAAGMIVSGALSVAIIDLRRAICSEAIYDGGYICLSNDAGRFWFQSVAALLLAAAAWLASVLVIPLLVGCRTRRAGWADATLLLVMFGSFAGHVATQYWAQREYPGMFAPRGGGPPVIWINTMFAMLVTRVVAGVVIGRSRERAEETESSVAT